MAEGLQKRFQTEVDKFRELQKEIDKLLRSRQQLEAQLTENNIVKEELERLEPPIKVFKLIGPALVRQEVAEAVQTVSKRIDFITGEMKRVEGLLHDYESKQEALKETLSKLQQQFQQAQVKAAIKA
ncbi:unnamed protein product [Soboliphyme baturini]|uniref:Probable prefoldin subunit 6 n=1 Tax=Soboliphyme baturini TaxID=241478 RepID=A0A183IDS6_9BILA|nr:unnamed protein product [Soboliphyme baturini]